MHTLVFAGETFFFSGSNEHRHPSGILPEKPTTQICTLTSTYKRCIYKIKYNKYPCKRNENLCQLMLHTISNLHNNKRMCCMTIDDCISLWRKSRGWVRKGLAVDSMSRRKWWCVKNFFQDNLKLVLHNFQNIKLRMCMWVRARTCLFSCVEKHFYVGKIIFCFIACTFLHY